METMTLWKKCQLLKLSRSDDLQQIVNYECLVGTKSENKFSRIQMEGKMYLL